MFGFGFRRGFTGEQKMTDSQQLLAEYAETGSETAFRELVARYVNLVYSTALRRVAGDMQLAEDVVQTVFIGLARRGRSLSSGVMLGGWLHQYACHTAAKAMRGERRRQAREQEAVQMNKLHDDPGANWRQVAPLLDQAITELGREDRTAVVLRFFEQRDFRSVGAALGTSEDAARMRVTRAVEKLRVLLQRRRVALSVAALGAALAGQAITAAPGGLAASVAGAALASAGAGSGISAAFLKVVTMTKLKAGILSAVVIAGAATSLVVQHQNELNLRQENRALRQQIAQLQTDHASLSNRAAQAEGSRSLSSDRLRELLRLRNEVGSLRRHVRELDQAAAAGAARASASARQAASSAGPASARPLPFQLQLVLDEPGENTQAMTNHAGKAGDETLQVQKTPLLDHTAIRSAAVTANPATGEPQIDVEFSEVGKELFAAITRENLNKRLAIVLDGHLYAAPMIRSEISEGKAVVTGSFTEEEARGLAAKISEAIQSQ
jgi:RNA polymerase sigma factor (sigma-70 family)